MRRARASVAAARTKLIQSTTQRSGVPQITQRQFLGVAGPYYCCWSSTVPTRSSNKHRVEGTRVRKHEGKKARGHANVPNPWREREICVPSRNLTCTSYGLALMKAMSAAVG